MQLISVFQVTVYPRQRFPGLNPTFSNVQVPAPLKHPSAVSLKFQLRTAKALSYLWPSGFHKKLQISVGR